ARGSEVEEHRFTLALENDVPLERALADLAGNQRGAALRGHEREHRVGGVCRIAGKIHARHELLQQAAHEDRDAEMRRLDVLACSGHAAGLDGAEAERAFIIGERPAVAAERRLERLRLLVLRAGVAAVAVRLPDLDPRIVHRSAIAIDDAAADGDALPRHTARRELLDLHPFEPDALVWSDGLPRACAQAHRTFSVGVCSRPRRTISKR